MFLTFNQMYIVVYFIFQKHRTIIILGQNFKKNVLCRLSQYLKIVFKFFNPIFQKAACRHQSYSDFLRLQINLLDQQPGQNSSVRSRDSIMFKTFTWARWKEPWGKSTREKGHNKSMFNLQGFAKQKEYFKLEIDVNKP